MTRKTIGYTHLQWTCPACGHKNLGTAEKCSSCQSPQPEDVIFEQPAQEELITQTELISRAQSGPDIHCAYCGTRNLASATHCSQCGADLAEGTARDKGVALGSHRQEAAPDVACAYCGTPNPANALACSNCGASMAAAQEKRPSPQPKTPPKAAKSVAPLIIGLLVLCCLGVLFITFLFNSTEEVIGQVRSVEWERTITVEELGPVTHEDWLQDVPSSASLGSCSERVQRTQSSPGPRAVEVCGNPYTIDTGTGIGEVVQDCEYQVYGDWCEYTVLDWRTADTLITRGTDYSPLWPQYSPLNDQRLGQRQESYRVFFNADGNNYTYTLNNPNAFTSFTTGSEWILEVNTFSMVVGVQPAD